MGGASQCGAGTPHCDSNLLWYKIKGEASKLQSVRYRTGTGTSTGEASMPNGTKSRERHRSFSRYGTSTRSACTGTDRIYVASTSRQVEFTSHLQVLNVAFTTKIYVAHATRCELSSKVTVSDRPRRARVQVESNSRSDSYIRTRLPVLSS